MNNKNKLKRQEIRELLNLINQIQDKLFDFQIKTGIDYNSVYYDDLCSELKDEIFLEHPLSPEETKLGESLINAEHSLINLQYVLESYSEYSNNN